MLLGINAGSTNVNVVGKKALCNLKDFFFNTNTALILLAANRLRGGNIPPYPILFWAIFCQLFPCGCGSVCGLPVSSRCKVGLNC